jgi:hypothetical protein
MTSLYQCELRIGLEDFKGQTGYAKYTTFSIGDASEIQIRVRGTTALNNKRLRKKNKTTKSKTNK